MEAIADREANERNVYRFLANLWLRPESIWRIVEYWMRNYEPLAIDNGALAPRSLEPSEFYHTLLARMFVGPDDMNLHGQGNFAVSGNANEPRYVHYINFMAPSASDFTLAISDRHFIHERLEPVAVSLLPLYDNPMQVWKRGQRGTTMGDHFFDQFHINGDLFGWRSLFSPVAFAAEIMHRALCGLRQCKSMEWLARHGLTTIARWVEAFQAAGSSNTTTLSTNKKRTTPSQFAQVEQPLLKAYCADMQHVLAPSTVLGVLERIQRCASLTAELRMVSQGTVLDMYKVMASVLECPFALYKAPKRPWNLPPPPPVPASTQRIGDEKEKEEEIDAMDIDEVR